MTLQDKYNFAASNIGDINEHIPTLKIYGEKCKHITEFGVRSIISTWAFLYAQPDTLVSIDIVDPIQHGSDINDVYKLKGRTDFKFIKADTTKIKIEQTDLLFIDTLHTENQLKKELEIHSGNVNKYIILHDTRSFWDEGENGGGARGLKYAVEPFILYSEWKIHEKFDNNNGLMILCKK